MWSLWHIWVRVNKLLSIYFWRSLQNQKKILTHINKVSQIWSKENCSESSTNLNPCFPGNRFSSTQYSISICCNHYIFFFFRNIDVCSRLYTMLNSALCVHLASHWRMCCCHCHYCYMNTFVRPAVVASALGGVVTDAGSWVSCMELGDQLGSIYNSQTWWWLRQPARL